MPALIFLLTSEATNNDYSNFSFLVLRFFTFILVFVVIIGAAYFTSKFISNKSISFMNQKNLKIIERLPIGIDKSLYLINLDSQYYILSTTKTQIEIIDKFNKEDINIIEHFDKNNTTNGGFNTFFNKFLQNNRILKQSELDQKPFEINLTGKLMEIQKRSTEIKEGLKEDQDRTKTNEKRR